MKISLGILILLIISKDLFHVRSVKNKVFSNIWTPLLMDLLMLRTPLFTPHLSDLWTHCRVRAAEARHAGHLISRQRPGLGGDIIVQGVNIEM